MTSRNEGSPACPHGMCAHSLLSHVVLTEGYGNARAVSFGHCSVCESKAMHGESGLHQCSKVSLEAP